MTPHTPLIEALKLVQVFQIEDDDRIFLAINGHKACAVPGSSTAAGLLLAFAAKQREALRIATETTEPDAAQSIRAEALEEAAKIADDFDWYSMGGPQDIGPNAIEKVSDEIATAIREATHDS